MSQPSLPVTQQQQQSHSSAKNKPFEIVPAPTGARTSPLANPKEPSPKISLGPSSSSSSASSSNGTGSNPNSLLETGLLLANLQKANPLLVASILSSSGLSKASIPGLTQLLGTLTEQSPTPPKKAPRRRSNSQFQAAPQHNRQPSPMHQQHQQQIPQPQLQMPMFQPPQKSSPSPQHPPPSDSPSPHSLSQQIKLLQQVQMQQQQKLLIEQQQKAVLEQQQKAAQEQKRIQEQKQKQAQMLAQLQAQQKAQSAAAAAAAAVAAQSSPAITANTRAPVTPNQTSSSSSSSSATASLASGFPFDPLYLSAIYANPSLYLQALSPEQLLQFYKNLPSVTGIAPPSSKS
ncbi:PAX-interacting protein 1-like [Toxorhynchites rutilus septentrionalis]|uniref:PAX-interacting protein 1-like n=1 Tax=Toxorhynchites rutilus septentrionalis TaxID=329112 RepID=UPI00247B221F|nr:PAX-interacting protein 1-like [Toxorhynchites rutilus septentrionalis]